MPTTPITWTGGLGRPPRHSPGLRAQTEKLARPEDFDDQTQIRNVYAPPRDMDDSRPSLDLNRLQAEVDQFRSALQDIIAMAASSGEPGARLAQIGRRARAALRDERMPRD